MKPPLTHLCIVVTELGFLSSSAFSLSDTSLCLHFHSAIPVVLCIDCFLWFLVNSDVAVIMSSSSLLF